MNVIEWTKALFWIALGICIFDSYFISEDVLLFSFIWIALTIAAFVCSIISLTKKPKKKGLLIAILILTGFITVFFVLGMLIATIGVLLYV